MLSCCEGTHTPHYSHSNEHQYRDTTPRNIMYTYGTIIPNYTANLCSVQCLLAVLSAPHSQTRQTAHAKPHGQQLATDGNAHPVYSRLYDSPCDCVAMYIMLWCFIHMHAQYQNNACVNTPDNVSEGGCKTRPERIIIMATRVLRVRHAYRCICI